MRVVNPYDDFNQFVYVCNVGESLADIAYKFSVSESYLRKINGLVLDVCCGDELVITRKKGTMYRVRAGENAGSIAVKFGFSVEKLLAYNDVEFIYPGQILFVDS